MMMNPFFFPFLGVTSSGLIVDGFGRMVINYYN